MRCPTCASELPEAGRFCAFCGTPVDVPDGTAATVAMGRPRTHPSSSGALDEGRFPAGTLLAERYRILGLIGRGGMGEVYRANDLKLGQPVALKFLPEEMSLNQRWLARFHGEVRLARQVSHPNVCRVYDIGEYQGATFITMEYADGEDLASLLRRIGRLPGDKATEIARKLCAGLAAAHDKGVLHRDLKPANIMIDGRGQVLITDFGLAGIEGQIEGGEVRHGTPAYQAPEQIAGREVTVRSDIYALGLVLYEMFTGKRAFEDARRATPTSVSTLVKDIDPAVERVIMRCLEEDPRNRPASARALRGGDPLAAAIAAGETPSPEMVAAAGETEGFSIRTLGLLLTCVVVGLAACLWIIGATSVPQMIPFEMTPEALAYQSRQLISSFGYTASPLDQAFGFGYDTEFQQHGERSEKPTDYRGQLIAGQPALMYFWYRQSPRYLEPLNAYTVVDQSDPPAEVSGMVQMRLDPQGRLLTFHAVPPQVEAAAAAQGTGGKTTGATDWNRFFAAAGLDPARFTAAEPQWAPLAHFDARAAWNGAFPQATGVALRIEAASWRGRPVDY
jgi:serine/threonine-protein kinase